MSHELFTWVRYRQLLSTELAPRSTRSQGPMTERRVAFVGRAAHGDDGSAELRDHPRSDAKPCQVLIHSPSPPWRRRQPSSCGGT